MCFSVLAIILSSKLSLQILFSALFILHITSISDTIKQFEQRYFDTSFLKPCSSQHASMHASLHRIDQ